MSDRTTITVSDGVWEYLNDKKDRGDSFDDVLRRELGLDAEQDAKERIHREQPDIDARAQLRPHVAGSGPLLERRLDALEAMVEHLQAEGEATKGDLLPLADPDAVDYKDADSVWSNLVKGTLSEVDGVQSPPSGKETWRWTGQKED